jgi:hypothetical protein
MRRATTSGKLLFLALLALSAVALLAVAGITYAIFVLAPKYGLLRVPIASWFVFGLNGLIVALCMAMIYLGYRLRRTDRESGGLLNQAPGERIPTVGGHKCLDEAAFLPLVQMLFRGLPDVQHIQIRPLPGGYGGSTTVLAELRRERNGLPLPRSFVVKLGERDEMAGEREKFQRHVQWRLPYAARLLGYEELDRFAGIAYEFVGLEVDHEIQNLHQFYRGYTTIEVTKLIEDVYSQLGRAWYHDRLTDPADLYREYGLLHQKQALILEHVERIVDENDRYRRNFTVAKEELQHNLKPAFCPVLDIPWHDPVAFLRTWPKQDLTVPVHRSVVHGDLNARNVLVEVGKDGRKHVWFIDFSHTGNGLSRARAGEAVDPHWGHTLRDFCRLEADVKFILTRLCDANDLVLAVAFEKELLAYGMALPEAQAKSPHTPALADERFKKAWQAIREIRRLAAHYLVNADDLRPYYLSLLHATLPIVYYHQVQFDDEACERQQKRYALLAAGMLCRQL